MTQYPTKEQLNASVEQYALSPTFHSHPDEPGTTFNPEGAEVRFIAISGKRRRKIQQNIKYLDAIDYTSIGGFKEEIKSEDDLQTYLKRIYKDVKDLNDLYIGDEGKIHRALETTPVTQRPVGNNRAASPIDIDISRQCYVVLILHHQLSWRFTPRSRGVTTKKFYGCDNFGLTFATPDGSGGLKFSDPKRVLSVPSEDCRQVYFSAARRRPDCDPEVAGYHSAQKFNFHIDFFNEHSLQSLPTIFDPTVPNSGGASFP